MSPRQAFQLLLLLPLLAINWAHARSTEASDAAAATAVNANAPKIPAVKTITNFSEALRCMDEMFIGFGKANIVVTSAGVPDETGKVRTGTKEMLITAISKMSLKSRAFDFIDISQGSELNVLFNSMGTTRPDYYIRGSITQMDDNAVRKNVGGGFALPFFDFSASKDDSYDVLSMDMSVGEAATRRILPETATSNTIVLQKNGRSGETGGRLGKAGLSFNLDLSRAEGVGAATRTLVELGMIETMGKFTRVPYWKCLEIESTNPQMMSVAHEWYDAATEQERILFIQRKLKGMGRYAGNLDGQASEALKDAISEYQAQNHLIADGRINFNLYYSLLDDTQNTLAALPQSSQKPNTPRPPSSSIAGSGQASATESGQTEAPPRPAKAFQVKLDSEKGSRPTFKVGDILNMTLSLNGSGTVYCYYEDVGRSTSRIFPNKFNGDALLSGGNLIRLPSGGFKIRFDKPGREQVSCVGSDRELLVPSILRGTADLQPLPVKSLEEILKLFRTDNPTAVVSSLEIQVQP